MRTARRTSVGLAVCYLALSACDVSVQAGDKDGGGGGTGTGGGSGVGGGDLSSLLLCSNSKPCPAGQFCFNGACVPGCQSNGDCATDQYCQTEGDRLCHNKTVTTCPQVACASTQICEGGFCSTPPPPTQCDPQQVLNGNDGCDNTSVCIDSQSTSTADPKCYSFPACGADKTCPTGLRGAVCNDGLIPNKGLICLTGLCKDASNCPSQWNCVKFGAGVAGQCSNGVLGSPCSKPSECTSGNCQSFGPGTPGFCF